MKTMPMINRIKSINLLLKFFSLKMIAPEMKETRTLLRRIMLTIDIMAPLMLSE
jgi:hypothetical protein